MLHGESRFFNNWQMPKNVSAELHKSLKPNDDIDNLPSYVKIIEGWLESTKIFDRVHHKGKDETEW